MTKETLTILVVDDEPEARDLLQMLLSGVPGIAISGYAGNVDEALAQVRRQVPDLVLLDIQMPGKSGFDLVSSLRKLGIDTGYIFVTAYDEYAIKAIRESAFDYLLKPVDKDELVEAVLRYRQVKRQQDVERSLDDLLKHLGLGERLKLNTRTGFILIDPADVICCRADGNYTRIVLTGGRREIISSNLGNMEKELRGNGFFRISRSSLINLQYLTHVDCKKGICRLQADTVSELKGTKVQLKKLEQMLG